MTSLLNIAGNIPVSAAVEGQSLRFEDGDSPYLENTPTVEGDRRTFTISVWAKRGLVGSAQNIFQTRADSNSSQQFSLQFKNNDKIRIIDQKSGVNELIYDTNAVFRDVSAWYHIVVAVDTTESVNTDRCKLYVNGEQVTSFSTQSPKYDSNYQTSVNNDAKRILIGAQRPNSSSTLDSYFDGYLANFCLIDGQALTPTSFGEYDDTLWRPKSDADITGNLTFGTNGFYLPFKQTTEAEGFSTVTYTGNGGTQSIEGVGFEPDFVWIKNRDTGYQHQAYDSVRGATKKLLVSDTDAETTDTNGLTSFDSSGFSLGSNVGVNESGKKHVAWCWDAGSGSAVSNTDGSITSTVKANTAKGFSITSYSGTGNASDTVGHGLTSSAPDLIILKNRDTARNWTVYNSVSGATKYLLLNTTNADQTGTSIWNDTAPTTSVFSIGTSDNVNKSGDDYIAYCFHSVSGYSSIGSYSGTGAAGNSITGLGFKPAWLMLKRTDTTADWIIWDATRDVDGKIDGFLYPNLSAAEAFGSNVCTFDSDGFTLNDGTANRNASGGTYIYMAFADTRDATFFGDTSGNGNNLTPNKLNNTDVVPDSPVSGGNFATYNSALNSSMVLSEGNLEATQASAAWLTTAATFAVSSGKWYWESKNTGGLYQMIGIVADSFNSYAGFVGNTADSYSYYPLNGQATSYKYNNAVPTVYGNIGTTGDIFGVALDLDAGTLEFFKNNVSQGVAFTGLSGTFSPALSHYTSDSIANFGQDSSFAGNETPQGNTDDNGVGDFYYAPPSGYLCLKTSSLPTATITAPDEYFNTLLYAGTGSSQSITGVNFQPDWVWAKARNGAFSHGLFDSVRGATKRLQSQSTAAEDTTGLTSFDSDGFTTSNYNSSGYNYVAWNWKAGGTAVSNTDGSITSQVSANTDAGFSIVSYNSNSSGQDTVGHGLTSTPEMIITKSRDDGTFNWSVFHADVCDTTSKFLRLNTTDAITTYSTIWGAALPTSSVFGITSGGGVQASDACIAYCFHSVESYSKCGSYTGNGSSDGVYVHLGFRPSWIMVKRTNSTSAWTILDNKRDPFNEMDTILNANATTAESSFGTTNRNVDFLSNGFKIRYTTAGGLTDLNASGSTYIFLAFAEAPFKSANAR